MEKKFVVFSSELDLKAHQLSEHGNTLSKDVRRDARVVDMSSFDFRQSYQHEQRRGGGGGRESRRGRDPNAEPLPASSAQPLRRDELAFQRTMAIHSAQSVSNRTFGGSLTQASSAPSRPSNNNSSAQPAAAAASRPTQNMVDAMETLSITDLSSLTPEQRASLTRHGAVVERATNLLGSDPSKLATFRSHISSFNRNSMTAEQMIEAFFSLFSETSANALGTLVREVADLFEDRRKGNLFAKPGRTGERPTRTTPPCRAWEACMAQPPLPVAGQQPRQQAWQRPREMQAPNRSTQHGCSDSRTAPEGEAPLQLGLRSSPWAVEAAEGLARQQAQHFLHCRGRRVPRALLSPCGLAELAHRHRGRQHHQVAAAVLAV